MNSNESFSQLKTDKSTSYIEFDTCSHCDHYFEFSNDLNACYNFGMINDDNGNAAVDVKLNFATA